MSTVKIQKDPIGKTVPIHEIKFNEYAIGRNDSNATPISAKNVKRKRKDSRGNKMSRQVNIYKYFIIRRYLLY
jgi:hypothetical protein